MMYIHFMPNKSYQRVNAIRFYEFIYSIALRTLLLSPLRYVLKYIHVKVQFE